MHLPFPLPREFTTSTATSLILHPATMGVDAEPPNSIPGKSHVTLRERLQHFTWAWFSCTMATGALAAVLHQTPNRFRGLTTVGTIVFIIDIVLFLSFSVLISLRFILRPKSLLASLHHPQESFFFGTFWVSLSLMIQNMAQYGVPSSGPWLVKALEVCFWLYAGLIMLVAILEYQYLFFAGQYQVQAMMPAWILPIYPMLVTGPLAVALLASQPPRAALPIFIAGVLFQGLGWIVSMFLYAIYMIRLMAYEVPNSAMRPGMFIAVGPVSVLLSSTCQLQC
jgi:C4-dicarboxylate transporter/malic acid transport protein